MYNLDLRNTFVKKQTQSKHLQAIGVMVQAKQCTVFSVTIDSKRYRMKV